MEKMTIEDARSLMMAGSGASEDDAGDAAVGRESAREHSSERGSGLEEGAVPAGTQLPGEGAVPAGTQLPDEGAAPAGTQLPDEGAVPVEMQFSDEDGQRSYADGSVGLGVDIVEIERMQGILARNPQFAQRVFSPEEQAYCDGTANPATHYALRFAAKEAVVKALGTGFAEGIWVRDIEVERNKKGRPTVKLSGRALEVAEEQGVRDLSLSLSYTRTDAVACALAVTESSLRASEKRKDPMEELARQFKETRKILDEL